MGDEVDLYYIEPKDSEFQELKEKAMKLWSTKGQEPSYSKEKMDLIKNIQNIEDNFMHIVAMFDIENMKLLSSKLSDATRESVKDRLISVESFEILNIFITDVT